MFQVWNSYTGSTTCLVTPGQKHTNHGKASSKLGALKLSRIDPSFIIFGSIIITIVLLPSSLAANHRLNFTSWIYYSSHSSGMLYYVICYWGEWYIWGVDGVVCGSTGVRTTGVRTTGVRRAIEISSCLLVFGRSDFIKLSPYRIIFIPSDLFLEAAIVDDGRCWIVEVAMAESMCYVIISSGCVTWYVLLPRWCVIFMQYRHVFVRTKPWHVDLFHWSGRRRRLRRRWCYCCCLFLVGYLYVEWYVKSHAEWYMRLVNLMFRG